MRMEAGLDTGPVAAMRALTIADDDTAGIAVRQARRARARGCSRRRCPSIAGRTRRADAAGARGGDAGADADQGRRPSRASIGRRARSPRMRAASIRGRGRARCSTARRSSCSRRASSRPTPMRHRRRGPGEVLGLRPEGLAVACAGGAIAFGELQLPGRRAHAGRGGARRAPHPRRHGPRVTGRRRTAGTPADTPTARSRPNARPASALTARALARTVLERVEVGGAYANRALSAALDRATALGAEDRALATELVYGVLRRRGAHRSRAAPLATSGLRQAGRRGC